MKLGVQLYSLREQVKQLGVEEVLKMVILRMSVRTGAFVSFAAIVIRSAVVEICW